MSKKEKWICYNKFHSKFSELDRCKLITSRFKYPNISDIMESSLSKGTRGYPLECFVTPDNLKVQHIASSIKNFDDINFVMREIEYMEDGILEDYWQFPWETLEKKTGDCEDQATTLISILRCLGYEAWVVIGLIKSQNIWDGHAWGQYINPENRKYEYLEPTGENVKDFSWQNHIVYGWLTERSFLKFKGNINEINRIILRASFEQEHPSSRIIEDLNGRKYPSLKNFNYIKTKIRVFNFY